MAAWKNILLASVLGCSLAFGCKIGSSDDDIEDTSDDKEYGGSKNSGKGGNTAAEAGSENGGTGGEDVANGGTGGEDVANGGTGGEDVTVEYSEDECAYYASLEQKDSCTECMFQSLCSLTIACMNVDGCYEAVVGGANCVYDAWNANDLDTEDMELDGFITSSQEDECAQEYSVATSGGNELWTAMAGRDDIETNNACDMYCYMGPDDVIDVHH